MSNSDPIGVFDSGFGGISVLNQLTELMPHERFLYVADNAFCPYGNKNQSYIQNRSSHIVDYLLKNHVKMIVVACNTATASAIKFLRNRYPVPFVGMEPAIKPAAALSKTNVVGILATQSTFNGDLFKETKKRYAPHINTIIQVGEGLVEIVENDKINSAEARFLISKYITPMLLANADYLVLGCTHYPFLKNIIKSIAPSLQILDPAKPVARRTLKLLEMHNLVSITSIIAEIELFTTGSVDKLSAFADSYVNGTWSVKSIQP